MVSPRLLCYYIKNRNAIDFYVFFAFIQKYNVFAWHKFTVPQTTQASRLLAGINLHCPFFGLFSIVRGLVYKKFHPVFSAGMQLVKNTHTKNSRPSHRHFYPYTISLNHNPHFPHTFSFPPFSFPTCFPSISHIFFSNIISTKN